MPWIHVTSTVLPAGAGGGQALADDLSRAAADVLGLAPADIVVLISHAAASSGSGAVATVAGRSRAAAAETELLDSIRRVVAAATGLTGDLVAVVRC